MNQNVQRVAALAIAGAVALSISACSPTPQPEAIRTPVAETVQPTAEPVQSVEAPQAAVGTRDNPVPIGQVLAFGPESAFQVGSSAPTQVTAGYSVLPLVIQVDWANFNAQSTAQGQPTGGPVTPITNFGVSFVTAAGKSYDTMDDYSADIPNELYDIGDVYEGTDVISANVPRSVPESEVAGGTWVVENYASGARVFVAAQ